MSLITVSGLRKSSGASEILRGIDLDVDQGEIVGVLGPNGAGKSTAIECIGGLRRRDGGTVRVDGMDPDDAPARLREILGMQLQQCRMPAKITAREALDLFASYYAHPVPSVELLDRFGLADKADARFAKLSGGQQQRLSVALALIGRPRIAILDELTTGPDPAARRDIWNYLAELRADGVTLMLVTHSMEEAHFLCDRVLVLRQGSIVAEGTPDELTGATGRQDISFARPSTWGAALREVVGSLPGVGSVRQDRGRIILTGDAQSPQAVIAALAAANVAVEQLRVTTPTLDDAYLALTSSTADQETR